MRGSACGLLVLAFSACHPTAAAVRTPPPPESALQIECSDPLALVYVDDRLVGQAGDLKQPVGLRAGLHRVELRAEGKLSAYREVLLRPGERPTLKVMLHPDLDTPLGTEDRGPRAADIPVSGP
ncbi:MAG TPA: hypothetical protein VH877_05605 [Polyangia bacterium]|jgi:hypothetical protein|nr:hypothetical protein [Polyangia bacterium]